MGLRIRMILMIKCCVKNKDDTPESQFSVVCCRYVFQGLLAHWCHRECSLKKRTEGN